MTLTPLALENADVLRRLTNPDAFALTFTAFAAALPRDPSNLRKTLHRLEAEGMALRDETAACGWRAEPDALAALDRLEGLNAPVSAAAPIRWPHDLLVPDPTQPRKAFDPDALADLARSIAAAGDVLTPLLVLPADASGARTFKAGERRWRAVELLMAGAVPDCILPPALDSAMGGGLPIREIAPAPGDTAWIALTENGNREPLNPIEDGEALLALMTARDWSAREAAHQLGRVGKTTGQPGAGSDGVKTVQERVKVAREATAEDKARFLTDPDFTWKDLLATVQAAKPQPAPPADVAGAPGPDPTIGTRPGDFVPLTPEVTYDIEAMGWGFKGLNAYITLARDPEGGWRYGLRFWQGEAGSSEAPGFFVGEASTMLSRQQAFADAEAYLRRQAAKWQGPKLPHAVRVIEWLNALGDGTADPADIPPRKPTIWDAEAERIARGEGGASGPARAKAAATGADDFEEDLVPLYLRPLDGAPAAPDEVETTPASSADDIGDAQDAAQDEEGSVHPGESREPTLDDILGPLTLLNIVHAADPATGPAFLSGLFERVGFQPPFTAELANLLEAGTLFDAAGRCVLVCDASGDQPNAMALAQAIVVAAALNAALGLSVDVSPSTAQPAGEPA